MLDYSVQARVQVCLLKIIIINFNWQILSIRFLVQIVIFLILINFMMYNVSMKH